MPQTDPDDPKGLIRESFRIEGISDAECRSIMVDWALSLDAALDPVAALKRLHGRHAVTMPGHPMTSLLLEAAAARPGQARRRGGRAGRMTGMQTGRQ
jgi:hypothetical protein